MLYPVRVIWLFSQLVPLVTKGTNCEVVGKWKKSLNLLGKMEDESVMGKWSNFQKPVSGRYKLFSMVVSALLIVSLLWQGVFAMLGTTSVDADAFAMMEAFSADVGDGLHEQRQAAWNYAVRNPAAEGGVWAQFWGNAYFGVAGAEAVPTPTLPPLPPPGPRSIFADSRGIIWRVIAAEDNSRLIMTEHVHMQGTPYNLTNVYTRLSYSNLRVGLDTWGAENLAPELAARARVPNNVDNDVRDTGGSFNASENGAAGWTSPGAAAANAPGALFVLSISELHQHAAAVGTTDAARVARNTAGTVNNWWLRSPGNNASAFVALVITNGAVGITSATNTNPDNGTRPALWINL